MERKGDVTGSKWGGGCLDRLLVVTMGRWSAPSFQPSMGGNGRTSDISACPGTKNVFIGAVKLWEQEIILTCG